MANKMINLQKKISIPKVLGGKINRRAVEDAPNSQIDLIQVVGVASGIKTGSTQFGDWVALTGNFAAINLETGEQFRSGVCFLPDVALDPVVGQLNSGASAVEFGYTIGAKANSEIAVGYEYYARPLVEPDENDPLEKLVSVMDSPKSLPSPETASEVEGEVDRGNTKAKAKK